MSHFREPLKEYRHQQLMDDLNELLICVKVHLYGLQVQRPKPTVEDLDMMQHRVNEVLRQDARPMRR